MLDWLTTLTNDGITLLRLLVVAVAIFAVVRTFYMTQALVPVLSTVLVAGIAIWAVSPAGITQLENWIGSDASAAPAIVDVGTGDDPGAPVIVTGPVTT